jgi:glycosyltransferase involved in cell wall biosynthesis
MSQGAVNQRLRVMTMSDGIGAFGGAEELARQIAQRLDRGRFEPTFCATRWDPVPEAEQARAELSEAEVDFIGMERRSKLDLGAWRGLVRQMRDRRIDILHTHKIGSNFWGALIAPRVPVGVFVAHEHTWSWEGKPHRRFIDRNLIARRADAFVAVSESDRRRMVDIERIPGSKARFIPNGIPTPPRPAPGSEVRAELGISAEQPVVGMVATLRPQKAYDVLIRSASLLRREFADLRVLIAGGEENPQTREAEQLQRLIAELDLDGTVTLLGFRDDAFRVMGAFDVAAQSSNFEGSPLSVMEYMEAAKPVVATRVGGMPDLVQDGVTGLLVEPQDPEGLATALGSLLRDPDRAAEMGRAGRELRRSEFSIENTTSKVEELYEELWEARQRGQAR